MPNRKELVSKIPETTVIKLFTYPGKYGMLSSYPTSYCVGFERHNGGFVSQSFMSDWTVNYDEALEQYNRLKAVVGA